MAAPLPADARRLIAGRGLRAFADGFIAILLPIYLLALGFGVWQIGVLSTATLLGSSAMTWRWADGVTALRGRDCCSLRRRS